MINKIYCNDKRLHFKELEIKGRLNILVGGNGVGKTTLLNGIKRKEYEIESTTPIEIKQYSNSKDNYRVKTSANMTTPQMITQANAKFMSEGQSILYSLISFLGNIEKEAERLLEEKKSLIVILDEVDSGLSVDAINVLMHIIIDILNTHMNVQFFISSNNYHFTFVHNNIINMYNGKYQKINSYEEYFNLMISGMQKVGKKSNYSFLDKVDYWEGI